MTPNRAAALFFLLLAFSSATKARAQAVPTATRSAQLSVFGGATGTFTGLDSGKNLGITAGIDYSWYSWRGYHPSIELRGSYPIHKGGVDSLKYGLGGIRLDHRYNRRYLPYIDFLAGRGQIDYQSGGYPVGSISYISSTSNVFSFGGGGELDVSEHFGLKADYQYQFWASPITASGHQHPSVLTVGVLYRFGSSHPKHHYDRAPRPVVIVPAPAVATPPAEVVAPAPPSNQ